MEADGAVLSRIRNATAALLPKELKVEVKPRSASGTPSFDIVVSTQAAEHRFVGGWAGEGWPVDVERLFHVAPELDAVYAKRLTQRARAWLTERHVGWIDEAGNASIILPSGLIVVREARDVATPPRVPDRWTKTMLGAAEAVLAGVPPTVEAVETATGMSRGAAANALARIERRGLLDRPGPKRGRGASRTVVDLNAFVDEYAAAAAGFRAKQEVILLHRLWADPLQTLANEIGPGLTAEGLSWAVTGATASTLLAPYLGDVTVVEMYVENSLFMARERLADLLRARVVDKGQRIEIRELPTPVSERGPVVAGVHVALPARVYADLMASGGRFAEAAHHLREVHGVGPGSEPSGS